MVISEQLPGCMQNIGLQESELILNKDGSVYHLHLRSEHVADIVIIVGDQRRVQQVSQFFDSIDFTVQNREFVTHTGNYKGTRVTALSTGIGTDNIDIVVNELDAAVNIDPVKRAPNESRRKLNIIRIGTCGALQPDVPVGSQVISEFGLGLDGLIYYYQYKYDAIEKELTEKINEHLEWNPDLSTPYITKSSDKLIQTLEKGMVKGITATATGFYGPQGRRLSLAPKDTEINSRLRSFSHKNHRVVNFEMETSALYGLGNLLGHECCTCCSVIANRIRKEYKDDHGKDVDELIQTVLNRLILS
jgi:uridine phosphorylase